MKFWTSLCTCYRTIRNGDLHRYIHLEILENNSPLAMPATFWIQCKLYTLPKRKIVGRSIYNIYDKYISQLQNFKLFFEYFREVRKGNLQGQPETIADCENFVPSYFLHQATNLHILDSPHTIFFNGKLIERSPMKWNLSVWSMFCKNEYHRKLELKYWRKFCGKFRAMAK